MFDFSFTSYYYTSFLTSGTRALVAVRVHDDIDEVRSSTAELRHAVLAMASQDAGILAQTHDYDQALDSFGKRKAEWTTEETRKDQKALALIQLHLHNDIL